MEPLEQRQLLSVNIPIVNGNFESPTFGSTTERLIEPQPVAVGSIAPNYNQLDPRFGTPGWAKTAVICYAWSGTSLLNGSVGENGEGVYGAYDNGAARSGPGRWYAISLRPAVRF